MTKAQKAVRKIANAWRTSAARNKSIVEAKKAAREAEGDPNWFHPRGPEDEKGNSKGRGNQYTSMHIAADSGKVDVVKWLAEKGGADINIKCSYGATNYLCPLPLPI